VGGGELRVTGVITSYGFVECIEQFKHDPSFQLDGLYTPSANPPPNPSNWFEPEFDTEIDYEQPTADKSAGETLTAALETGKATITKKMVLAFDVGGDLAPIAATLVLNLLTTPAIDADIRLRRIVRAGLSDLANWNTYDGTNNWGTAGAENTSSDVTTTDQQTITVADDAPPGLSIEFGGASMLAMVAAARAGDGILRLLVECLTDPVGVDVASMEAAIPGDRPRLELNYEIPDPMAVQDSSRDANDLAWTPATPGSGDTFENDGAVALLVRNTGSGALPVTFVSTGTRDDNAIEDRVVSVGAGKVAWLGPFQRELHNDADGFVNVICEGAQDVKLAAVRVQR
jgi:hypothetical protein